ncbi:hypothetical protein ACGC1H_002473 [Rhizoctonia solani]
MLANLGGSLNYRFQHLGELSDLEKAIEHSSRALALTPASHPELSHRLSNLAASHSSRFMLLSESIDLEKAIEHQSRAIMVAPDGYPRLSTMLTNLGALHNYQFQQLGELGDLGKAIEYTSRALALTPDGHPRLPIMLTNLGGSHSYRFQQLGELYDLEQAIAYHSGALGLTPNNHPHLPAILANLGASHSHRFLRLGNLDDLDKAIEYNSRALTLTPDSHIDVSSRRAFLGVAYKNRFERLGELEDLERAIENETRALALTPQGHLDLSSRLANLGTSLSSRFKRLGELGDIEKAIEYDARALASTPDSHPDLPSRLANLGASHADRFHSVGKLSDLEQAIKYESRAIDLTPEGHPQLSGWLTNIGASYKSRYERLREVDDLEKAIEYSSRALALTPDGHPDLSVKHFNRAMSYFYYYEHTNDPTHLQDSLHSFRAATQPLFGAPRTRFHHALQWARLASDCHFLGYIEAYQTTLDLLPQFIWLGATTHQRYHDLSTIDTLAVDAAYTAILSADYALALEWLEHARCVVWNQHLMLRSPLDQLKSVNPTLATQLQTVANQLHSASYESRASREFQALTSGLTTAEKAALERRCLAQEYEHLLSQARTIPGFEEFLRPIKVTELVRATRNGPLVVISCHKERCDALVVLPDQDKIGHVPLPNFNEKKARRARSEVAVSIESRQSKEPGVERRPFADGECYHDFGNVLTDLWSDVVKPVLDFLGYTNDPPAASMPHIIWCPTGPISFLPLHAAGDYDQPRSRVFDYVISSYTPTLTALLESTPYSFTSQSRVLAIGQEHTPGHSSLPGTTRELACVKARTQHKAKYTELVNDHATTSAVVDAMEQHDWVHLACHAHQNVDDATHSGFFLHDGVLDLASINRRSLKNKGLAFLSACQTATGDERLADEAVHLASGMLMAGYTSVIATMWSVNDSDGPLVADEVYRQLVQDGQLGHGEAGKALHEAVGVLREKVGEQEFGRWVPYIHIGS